MNLQDLTFTHRFEQRSPGAPTLLLLHGAGGTEDELLSLGRTLVPEANLISPRGKVLENGMPRFFCRLAEGVFDLEDLSLRTGELADFVQRASAHYGFDPKKLIAVGYSNGANIAANLFLEHPECLVGGLLFRPMLPFQPRTFPDLKNRKICILSGEDDPIIPPGQATQLADFLGRAGAEVVHQWVPAGHQLTREEIVFAHQWISSVPGQAGR